MRLDKDKAKPKNKSKQSSIRHDIFITLVAAIIAIFSVCLPFHPTQKQLTILRKQFVIQYTPDVRVYVRSIDIYVGEGGKFDRIDDVILIPLDLHNKSYGLAKNIEIRILYNDGASGDKETNPNIIPVLGGGKSENLPSSLQSILANSNRLYSMGDKTFKMKIFIKWEDVNGTKYNSVELFRLYKTESYADYPYRFKFKSEGFYNNIDNLKELKKYSNHKIDF